MDTLGGRMHVRWDEGAAATQHGQLVFFAEFLTATGVFERWVSSCLLQYRSGNASGKRDVLGTRMLGLLAGHRCYAYITALRGDAVAAQALGLAYPLESIGQLYLDRADAENAFDELKNQWGLGGFTTQDLNRCQTVARAFALIYNWWSGYCRAAHPTGPFEAITSRPLLLAAVAMGPARPTRTRCTSRRCTAAPTCCAS